MNVHFQGAGQGNGGHPLKSPLIILGTGLFAEEIADYIHGLQQWNLAGFVEGVDRDKCGSAFLGRPVIWIDDVATLDSACVAICAVGSTRREQFIAQAPAAGLRFTTLVHPSAQVFASATVADGVIVGARTHIGAHAILNRGCLIGHHVDIGSYVTLGPGCNSAAKAKIGKATYIGMGGRVVDRVQIGSGCMVGAGALVARDLPDRVKAVGAPARVVKRDIDRV